MQIETISNNLLKLWDTKELADYLSAKYSDATIPLSKELKSSVYHILRNELYGQNLFRKLDENKQHLTEVLCIYGLCLCELIVEMEKDCSEVDKDSSNELRDKLNSVYYQVCRFASPWDNSAICLPFFLMHSYVYKCYGRMLKLLLKSYEEQCAVHVIVLIREVWVVLAVGARFMTYGNVQVLLKLEWHVLARHYELLIPVRHPLACQQMKR